MPVVQLDIPSQALQSSITVRLNTDHCKYPAYCVLRRVALVKPSMPGFTCTTYNLNNTLSSTSSYNVSNYISPYWLLTLTPTGLETGLVPDAITKQLVHTTPTNSIKWLRGTLVASSSRIYDVRIASEAWAQLHINKQCVLTQRSNVANPLTTELETTSNSYAFYLSANDSREIGTVSANVTAAGSNQTSLGIVATNTDYNIVSYINSPRVITIQVNGLSQTDGTAHTLFPFDDDAQVVNVHHLHRLLGRIDNGGDVFIDLTFNDIPNYDPVAIPHIQLTFELLDCDM